MIKAPQDELIQVRRKLTDDLPAVLELRPLPFLALKINEQCRNHHSDIDRIIELIQCEPATAAKILSIVNSPLYAYSREIDSIKQAVVVLGFKRLAEVAMSIASHEVFSDENDGSDFGMPLYEHSLAVATTSRLLAQQSTGLIDDGAAFLAGLLHDVGKLFFFDLAPGVYMALLDTLETSCSVEHEYALFGKSHSEMGLHFAHNYGMPSSIRGAIEQHHASESLQQSDLAKTVDLANSLVKLWNISGQYTEPQTANLVAQQWLEETDQETVSEFRELARRHYRTLRSLILE